MMAIKGVAKIGIHACDRIIAVEKLAIAPQSAFDACQAILRSLCIKGGDAAKLLAK